jgi:hypothetical protein
MKIQSFEPSAYRPLPTRRQAPTEAVDTFTPSTQEETGYGRTLGQIAGAAAGLGAGAIFSSYTGAPLLVGMGLCILGGLAVGAHLGGKLDS